MWHLLVLTSIGLTFTSEKLVLFLPLNPMLLKFRQILPFPASNEFQIFGLLKGTHISEHIFLFKYIKSNILLLILLVILWEKSSIFHVASWSLGVAGTVWQGRK